MARNVTRRPSATRRPPSRPGAARRRRRSQVPARRFAAAFSAVVVVALSVWALAGSVPEGPLDRPEVIERAMTWVDEGVPYSQTSHRGGYRTDCSGFVSMAWELPENLTTWRIPLVAEEIPKDDLRAGDVLLDYTSDDRHVVIFEKWADRDKTSYWAIESSGHPEISGTVRRIVPYPYLLNAEHYRPYRYVGMARYWDKVPTSHRQPVTAQEATGEGG